MGATRKEPLVDPLLTMRSKPVVSTSDYAERRTAGATAGACRSRLDFGRT
jgi:hypothetical protein